LRRFDYFAGKLGVIAVFLTIVAVLPAILGYALGVAFSADPTVVRDTIRVLGASVLYGAIVVLSAGTLMLAISSLSRNTRYVALTWVGLWLIPWVVSQILSQTLRSDWCPALSYTTNLLRMSEVLLDSKAAEAKFQSAFQQGLGQVSVRRAPVGRAPRGRGPMPPPPEFDEETGQPIMPTPPWYLSAGILGGLFGLSLWTLTSRVKSLDRLK
jgi:ABC-2 type transport system permease protein